MQPIFSINVLRLLSIPHVFQNKELYLINLPIPNNIPTIIPESITEGLLMIYAPDNTDFLDPTIWEYGFVPKFQEATNSKDIYPLYVVDQFSMGIDRKFEDDNCFIFLYCVDFFSGTNLPVKAEFFKCNKSDWINFHLIFNNKEYLGSRFVNEYFLAPDIIVYNMKRVGIDNAIKSFLETKVKDECKISGILKIVPFSQDSLQDFRENSNIDDFPEEDLKILIIMIIENAIKKGEITGLLDREALVYRDRSLIIQEQHILNLNVELDYNQLVDQLKNKGVILSRIQCPQCGAPSPIPQSGSVFKCTSCGNYIKVTDVFEKFNGLLG
jgi:hypothetical protein